MRICWERSEMTFMKLVGVLACSVLIGACASSGDGGSGDCRIGEARPCAASSKTAADWLSDFPPESNPASIARAAAEQILSTSQKCYKPKGYEGGTYQGRIHYSYVGAWVGALDAAQAMGDGELAERLIRHFEPVLSGPMQDLQNRKNHVDFTVFGALPLAIYNITGTGDASTSAFPTPTSSGRRRRRILLRHTTRSRLRGSRICGRGAIRRRRAFGSMTCT